jgi:L-glyceraldehyde 3-phosphate reductase
LIHQPKYSMFERTPETTGLFDVLSTEGVGCIAFTPLAQGLLSNRYLEGIPADSRAAKPHGFLKRKDIDDRRLGQVRALQEGARKRGQSLAQMALAWVLRQPAMTSVLIGASRVEQVDENVAALEHLDFAAEELSLIDTILRQ